MRYSLAAAVLASVVLSVAAADHLILVGAGGNLVFSPSNISAAVGDTISFQFQGKNHSVTQSTFANPCEIQTTPAQGIDSDFQFVDPTATQLPQWSFTVNNATSPLWFFCKQTNPAPHCQKGMVFSVNAVETGPKNFAAFQALAMGNAAAAPPSGAPSGAAGAASSIASDAGGAVGAATSAAGGVIAGATDAAGGAASVIASGAAAAATDAANALTAAGGAINSLVNGANPTGGANSTNPNSGARVGGSAMTLVAAVGLAAGLLL
jgi:hypothetical protein